MMIMARATSFFVNRGGAERAGAHLPDVARLRPLGRWRHGPAFQLWSI
jgi:hypothetical protein